MLVYIYIFLFIFRFGWRFCEFVERGTMFMGDVTSPFYRDTGARKKSLEGFAAHFSMTGKIGTVCKFFVICICLHNANLNSKNVFLENDVKKKNISRRNLLNVKGKVRQVETTFMNRNGQFQISGVYMGYNYPPENFFIKIFRF